MCLFPQDPDVGYSGIAEDADICFSAEMTFALDTASCAVSTVWQCEHGSAYFAGCSVQ